MKSTNANFKLQDFLWKLVPILTVIVIAFFTFQRCHKQYTAGRYTFDSVLYKACLQAQANATASGDSLTAEEIKECDSLHRLITDHQVKK